MNCKPNMIWKQNLHQPTFLAESLKALEARGCKPWVTNLLTIPHILGAVHYPQILLTV